MNNDRDFIKSIIGCVIPSDQSRSCLIDFDKINQDVKFDLSYKSLSGKVYHDEYTIDLKAGTGLVVSYAKADDKDLNIIANVMQEMIRHNL